MIQIKIPVFTKPQADIPRPVVEHERHTLQPCLFLAVVVSIWHTCRHTCTLASWLKPCTALPATSLLSLLWLYCSAAAADHGLYAHQTPTFDSYAASQDFPMHITENSTKDSYKLQGEVAGVLKMTGKDKQAKTKPLPGEQVSSAQDIKARLVFQAPTMVRWSRHDLQGKTNFISAFYLLPSGFGKTRFMSRYTAFLK